MASISITERSSYGKKTFLMRVRKKVKGRVVESISKTFSSKKSGMNWATKEKYRMEGKSFLLEPSKIIAANFDTSLNSRIDESSTIGDILNEFITQSALATKPYCKSYISAAKHIQEYDLAYFCPEDVEWEDIQEFCIQRKANSSKGVKASTIRIDISVIITAIKTCGELVNKDLNHAHFEMLQKSLNQFGYIEPSEVRSRRLSDLEEELIVPQLQKFTASSINKVNYLALFYLYIHTCARRQGLVNLRWEDVDWDKELMLIKDVKDTNRKGNILPRQIPITEDIKYWLLTMNPNKNIIKGRLFNATPKTLTTTIGNIFTAAGVDDYRLQDLRTEGISRYLELGLTIPQVAVISGHQDLKVLYKNYTHIKAKKVGKSIKRLQELIELAHSLKLAT